ncbi:hypothetical protein FNH47_18990 [Salmonella enterica subsp. houtenae]|uniref:Uncharacterized protein n=1 Tax=Salmonella houtenae TaxID=59205 RepID=A0A5Y2SIA8_SALHO|nr:hypothetical protein [Salmonella enterica subsp. houtenae]
MIANKPQHYCAQCCQQLDATCQRGSNLFAPEEIKHQYSDDDYRMLFGCDWSFAVAAGEVAA